MLTRHDNSRVLLLVCCRTPGPATGTAASRTAVEAEEQLS